MLFYDKCGNRLEESVLFGVCTKQNLNLKDVDHCPVRNFDDDGEVCVPQLCTYCDKNMEIVDGDLY